MQITFADGRQKGEKPDAENAMLFIRSGSRIYHFSCALGPMAGWPTIKTSPGEEGLMNFVSGFKPLKQVNRTKVPPSWRRSYSSSLRLRLYRILRRQSCSWFPCEPAPVGGE